MAVRRAIIKRDESLPDSGTTPVDLSKQGWISAILVEYYAQNGGTSNKDSHPHDCVSLLEVVDGSSILKTYSGVQAAGMHPFDHGVVQPDVLTENLSEYQRSYFAILFGRYIGDPQFAIHAKDFDNLQFKITQNLATVNAVGATGFLTTSGRYTVKVVTFDNEINPLGWFKTEQKAAWATALSGIHEVNLPTDHKYRRIFLRSFVTNNTFGISDITLNCGDGKYKPYDRVLPRQLARENIQQYHLMLKTHQKLFKQHSNTFESDIYDTLEGEYNAISSTLHNVGLTENYGLMTIDLSDLATPAPVAADEVLVAEVGGPRYQNMLCLPLDEGGELFDATQYGGVKLELNQNAVTRAASVILEELIEGRGLPST